MELRIDGIDKLVLRNLVDSIDTLSLLKSFRNDQPALLLPHVARYTQNTGSSSKRVFADYFLRMKLQHDLKLSTGPTRSSMNVSLLVIRDASGAVANPDAAIKSAQDKPDPESTNLMTIWTNLLREPSATDMTQAMKERTGEIVKLFLEYGANAKGSLHILPPSGDDNDSHMLQLPELLRLYCTRGNAIPREKVH